MSEYSCQPSVWGTVGSRGSGTRTHLLFSGPRWSRLSWPAPIFCFVLSSPEFVLFIPKLNPLQPRLTGLLKMSWTSWRLQKVLVSRQVQWEKQCSISVVQIYTVLCWLHIHFFYFLCQKFGEFEGKTFKDLFAAAQKHNKKWADFTPDGAETYEEVRFF